MSAGIERHVIRQLSKRRPRYIWKNAMDSSNLALPSRKLPKVKTVLIRNTLTGTSQGGRTRTGLTPRDSKSSSTLSPANPTRIAAELNLSVNTVSVHSRPISWTQLGIHKTADSCLRHPQRSGILRDEATRFHQESVGAGILSARFSFFRQEHSRISMLPTSRASWHLI